MGSFSRKFLKKLLNTVLFLITLSTTCSDWVADTMRIKNPENFRDTNFKVTL